MKSRMSLAVVLMAGTFLAAGEQRPKVTGIYSDMRFDEETGDVLGMELYVVFSSKGYIVVFQSSEGEPTVPVVVPARVHGNSIVFDVPESEPYAGRFEGTLTTEGMTAKLPTGKLSPTSGKGIVRFKRGAGYWQ